MRGTQAAVNDKSDYGITKEFILKDSEIAGCDKEGLHLRTQTRARNQIPRARKDTKGEHEAIFPRQSRQLVDGPVVFASFDDNDECEMGIKGMGPRWAMEECDGNSISARGQPFSTSDFETLRPGCVRTQIVAQLGIGRVLFEPIRQKQDGCFVVLGLPGVQKVIGRGEGLNVIGFEARRYRFGTCWHGGGENKDQDYIETAKPAAEIPNWEHSIS